MRDLHTAWAEAITFLNDLPKARFPILSIGFTQNIHGRPASSSCFLSIRYTKEEKTDKRICWSHHANDREDPANAVDECMQEAKAFLAGKRQTPVEMAGLAALIKKEPVFRNPIAKDHPPPPPDIDPLS